ncbi:MAG TPA: L,D-transpeptidase family protein [Bacillales bacterium]|nr:L,D-transpeptidase family protein [Bacillales bacterium]
MNAARVLLVFTLAAFLVFTSENSAKAESIDSTKIVVNLWKNQLTLFKNGHPAATYPIAPGKDRNPTPIGTFRVVQKSKEWGGGFGSRWLGLNVPWGKYGIHGTNKPYLMGQSVSSGCIRMRNRDVEELFSQVPMDTPVIINGPIFGRGEYAYRNLAVGSKGTVVQVVQNRLRAAGYYNGKIDGIYGAATKQAMIAFQKDRGLPPTGGVKRPTYHALGLLE